MRSELRQAALLALLAAGSCTSLARLSAIRGGGRPPVQLIDPAGSLNQDAATELASGSSELALITSVGAKGRGRRLMNDLFGTDFDTSSTAGGAWLAASAGAPSVLLLATEGGGADATADVRGAADDGKLASFSLALADAVLVHTPSTPSASQLQASYERMFMQRLALGAGAEAQKKVLLVHVGEGGEKAVRKACADAWQAAAAAAAMPAASFDEHYELECSPLPHATHEAAAYGAALEALGARLRALPGAGYGKALSGASLPGATAAAWGAASAGGVGAQPTDGALRERYLAEKAYDAAYSRSQATLGPWGSSVGAGQLVRSFGAKASELMEGVAADFEAAVADAPGAYSPLVAQRGAKLRKAVQNDVSALFAKQHKLLATQQLQLYKARLLRVVSRSGKLEAWQREGLQRECEKGFDGGLSGLFVGGLNGPTKQQLVDAFGKQLLAAATAFQESPALQLQAIAAVRRRTGKQQKQPRGFNVGLGLVGACHSKVGGGQGNLQTFAGYTAGLNSAHFLFSNDGGLPDSSGSEPDLLRFQPKLNFDIAI